MIPDEHLPPEFLKWFLDEAGQRPSDSNQLELAIDLQSKLRVLHAAEQLFEECRRYDMAKEIAFMAWMVAKEQK